MKEKLIEAVGSFKFLIESCGCTIGEYIVPYSIQEPLVDHLIAYGVVISNSETTTKWIPVTERLPDKNGEYLVSGAWRGEPAKTWICEFVVIGNVGGWANPARKPVVTHWMPLPEPPKGE